MSSTVAFSVTNRKVVASLYRQALRTSLNWINRRDHFRAIAVQIRAKFDENKHVRDPRELEEILNHTRALLARFKHPDPIIPPQRPGGTKYERNIHPPLDAPIIEQW